MARSIFATRNACQSWRDEDGAVMLEFGLIAPLLIAILVICADYSLALFASIQVQDAARAAAQYLLINGYQGTQASRQAIANAGQYAISTNGTSATVKSIAPITINPTTDIQLECASTSGGTYTSTGAYTFGAACSTDGSSFPYATITAHIAYSPIFPSYWSNLSAGKLSMTATAVTRFQ